MRKAWTAMGVVLAAALIAACAPKEDAPAEPDGAANEESAVDMGVNVHTQQNWDKLPDGRSVNMYTLQVPSGMTAKIIDWGATLVSLEVPDRNGKLEDVTLGFDKAEPYTGASPYMGATVGRYANRIALGKFTLDGQEYTLKVNNPPNSLHGGIAGFDKQMWTTSGPKGETIEGGGGSASITFTYTSKDGEEGFPGNVTCSITYTLTDKNELRMEYTATTDKATPINLTNHAYWNLAGATSGLKIVNHVLQINAEKYTPTDDTFIPTGELAPVEGTPVDFREPHAIGERIAEIPGTPGGYDHNFAIDGAIGTLREAAIVKDPGSGRVMKVLTTEPGLQFYTGNFLDGTLTGKDGTVYQKNTAFCLEAQKYPDSPNKPNFPTSIVRPGETYKQTTVHQFSVE